MNTFHALKIDSIKKETDFAVCIKFVIPEPLKKLFKFKQGQYITLKLKINGVEQRRSYSITNAPYLNDNYIEILVKKVEGGIVSAYLNSEIKAGTMIDIMPPMGNFYSTNNNINNHIFIATGSGISPIICNIKEILNTNPNAKIHLIYGNKTENSILLKENLIFLQKTFISNFKVDYFLSQENISNYINGRILPSNLKTILNKYSYEILNNSNFFICGHSDMINSIKEFLKIDLKINEENILFEFFVSNTTTKKIDNSNSNDLLNLTFYKNKEKTTLKDSIISESILDNILNKNFDVPFACKGGICTSCKVKLLEGEVEMINSDSLSSKEIKQNYILACQSYAKTKNIIISYDN